MHIITRLAIITTLIIWSASSAWAVRVKDLASVKGVRDNQLVGYGLVVGLNGTGDGNKSAFTTQGLANMLKHIGMTVNENDLKVKNVAGVMITATLPPFIKTGQTIDVTLSSLGDASSLQGGTLVATPLKGLDDQIYAIAQGPVSIGGFKGTGATPAGGQDNHLTVARIPEGATVEKEVPVSFGGKNTIIFSLNSPDFTTVSRLAKAINNFLGSSFAKTVDGATVSVTVPSDYQEQEISLLAALENLEVDPDSIAKVVVDERTGTIVMGENVRIGQLALSHGALNIQISADPAQAVGANLMGQPLTDDMVRKITEEIAAKSGAPQTNKLVKLSPGVTLAELVRALNSVGAAPRDLIAIFQAIKAAGALQAELTII
ncbi:MAG: flagellar basal body P-ring protein FlgI [Proteobacteria bacterium]|nr:flagellar basal body P-ring protein FlgI [Pseudomonadota bacterium]